MISIFLNLLRFVLCPVMWSIFENVPGAFEKNVYILLLWGERFCICQLSPFDLEGRVERGNGRKKGKGLYKEHV